MKKSLIITLLLRIQNLHISAWTDPFRDILFEKLKEFKGLYQYFNKGMLELLKYYGDPDTLITDNNLDPVLETQIVVVPEAEVKESPYQSSAKGNALGLPKTQSRSLIRARKSTPTEPSDRNNNEYSDQHLAVVPYEPKGGRQSKSQTRARA